MAGKNKKAAYTCNEYRTEMILLALERRLAENGLSQEEKKSLRAEIDRLKAEMDMD